MHRQVCKKIYMPNLFCYGHSLFVGAAASWWIATPLHGLLCTQARQRPARRHIQMSSIPFRFQQRRPPIGLANLAHSSCSSPRATFSRSSSVLTSDDNDGGIEGSGVAVEEGEVPGPPVVMHHRVARHVPAAVALPDLPLKRCQPPVLQGSNPTHPTPRYEPS
jgi:hypothetical protein